jgi:hypothetical protein
MDRFTDLPPAERAALEHSILLGLACEWETACRRLDPVHSRMLKRPLFALRDLTARWGYWSRERCEISLSRKLVFDCPWDAVREVLFHEMAHQLAEEVLGACREPPHGPTFRKACSLLGADPRASGSYPTLTERLARASSGPRDREMNRVRKLLSLAGSSNRHEAEAAMLKAHELIARHHLSLVADRRPREYASVFAGRPALRHSRFDYHLAGLMRDFYYVLPVWVPAFVLEKNRMGLVMEISGIPGNVRTAQHVADCLRRVARQEWRIASRPPARQRGRFVDFAVGLVEGFRGRLERSVSSVIPENPAGSALLRVMDPGLRDYGRRRYGRLVTVSSRASRSDPSAMEAGRRVGRRLVVSERATETRPHGGALPPPAGQRRG